MPAHRISAAALAAALAAVLAGCTTGHSAPDPTPTRTGSPTVPVAVDPHAPSVAKAPNLSEVNVPTLASAASLSKDTEFPLIGGIRASKTLAIAVNCKGTGTLTVAIEPSGLSFPLRCIPTQVTPTVNEIRFASTSKQAQITFTLSPMSDLAWSYSAGWDPHPAQLDQS